jgi:phospholipid-binding lipoprotein MlaA
MRPPEQSNRALRRASLVATLLIAGTLAPGAAAAEDPAPDLPSAASPNQPRVAESGDDAYYDPLERTNRAIFRFNDALSRTVAEPVGRAWRFTVPDFARQGMRNFFVNLAFPIRVVNTTLQLKPVATLQECGRFVINSTFGLGGVVDVATHGVNLPIHREDFGQTLGYWGVGEGPYLMIPVFGPSTIRDTVGLIADTTTGAATFSLIGLSLPFFATFAAQAGNYINSQSFVVDEVDAERENSLDFYASVRSTYIQFRRARVDDWEGSAEPAEDEDDAFYLEDDEPAAPAPELEP